MACTYCYQRPYERSMDSMDEELLKPILKKIELEINEIRTVNKEATIVIELFGGEPLQEKNHECIERILKFAREVNASMWIVTNGYELIEFLPIISQYRDVIRQINLTIDGSEEYHLIF